MLTLSQQVWEIFQPCFGHISFEETWASPPFITLPPKEPAPCCLGRCLAVTCVSAAGGLPGSSLLSASTHKSLGILRNQRAPDTGNTLTAAAGNSSPLSRLTSVEGSGSADFPVAIQPLTPKYFPPPGDKGKEGSLALVKCGADSFTASLGRGAERKSVRFNLC